MAYFKRGWNPQAVYEQDSLTAASGGGGGGVFVPAAHNSLLSIQGGSSTERYHLTAAQWQIAVQAATSLLDGYLTNEDWTTFYGKQAAYAILSTLGVLASSAGWLRNDGAGVLSYATPTAGDVGADPVGSASAVQGNLTTHIGLTGTAVHGLGTASTHADTDFAPASHELVGANHTESGLTADHFLKALSATTFGFAAHGLTASDVGADPAGSAAAAIAPWWTLATETHFTSGILSRTDNTLGLSTRTVTISPTGSDFDVYLDAVKFVKTGGASCSTTFGTDIGKHYIYFDATATLQNSTTAWVIKDGLAPVSIVWWNGSAARLTDERHSAARNVEAHQYLHKTRGTAWEEGLNCTYPNAANDGILQIEAGIIWDEDIEFAISQQRRCVLWYQTAAGVWTWVNGTDNGGYDRPYLWNAGTSRLQYPDTDLAYALTDAGPSNYLVVWAYASTDATPGDARPIYIVVPAISAPYNTIAQARAQTEPDVKTALSPELKLIYKWIYNGSGDFQEGQDFRTVSTLPGGITTTIPHNNTTGIQGGTTGEYYHLTSAQQAVIAAYTTVGAALLSVTDPSAITFLRINADNSVSTLSAADFRTAIGGASIGANTFTGGQRCDSGFAYGRNVIANIGYTAQYDYNGTFIGYNIYNTSTGASAKMGFNMNNNTCNAYLYLHGSGYSTSGQYVANGILLQNVGGTGGITLSTTTTAKIYFYYNNTHICDIDSNGIIMMSGYYLYGAHKSSDGTAGMNGTITFYAASSSGGAVNVLNTVTIKDGLITAWTQA